MQKRICVINDISCEGRCSVTAALPIYSAGGIHGNLIPTALLSTQTGGYTGYSYLDLSDEMIKIARHFKELDLYFDVLYTGYLASEKQVKLVMEIADILCANTLIVDPVMGDEGCLYDGFTHNYCNYMKLLCAKADIIVPNLTEACLLSGCKYSRKSEQEIKVIADSLRDCCNGKIVITGLKKLYDSSGDNRIGIAVYDNEELYTEFFPEVDGVFHGAGDVFGAVLSCGIAHGRDILEAAKFAHSFTYQAIKRTKGDKTDTRQGLNFEQCLGQIFQEYNK